MLDRKMTVRVRVCRSTIDGQTTRQRAPHVPQQGVVFTGTFSLITVANFRQPGMFRWWQTENIIVPQMTACNNISSCLQKQMGEALHDTKTHQDSLTPIVVVFPG